MFTTPRAAACPSCGAYGGSAHAFACQPNFHMDGLMQGAMRRSTTSSRRSAIVRAEAQAQAFLAQRLDT